MGVGRGGLVGVAVGEGEGGQVTVTLSQMGPKVGSCAEALFEPISLNTKRSMKTVKPVTLIISTLLGIKCTMSRDPSNIYYS